MLTPSGHRSVLLVEQLRQAQMTHTIHLSQTPVLMYVYQLFYAPTTWCYFSVSLCGVLTEQIEWSWIWSGVNILLSNMYLQTTRPLSIRGTHETYFQLPQKSSSTGRLYHPWILHSRTHSQVGLPVLLSWESTLFYIFGSKVVSQDPDFGLGYMRGQTKCGYIMKVILDMIDEGCNCTLWCDAYGTIKKVTQNTHWFRWIW